MARRRLVRLVLDHAATRLDIGVRSSERYDAEDLDALAELAELEILALNEQTLERLPKLTQPRLHTLELSAIKSLRSLDGIAAAVGLRRLTLEDLPDLDYATAFEQLAELPELVELRLVRVGVMPPSIARLHSLLVVHLRACHDLDLAGAFETLGAMPFVRTLHVDHRQTPLPDAFAPLGQTIETLVLSLNKLKTLPRSIGALARLRVLRASDNGLTKLPEELCDCGALEQLVLVRNPLTKLPARIGDLARLHTLHAQFTRLTTLPPSIGALANLRDLGLPQTIKRVPAEVSALALNTLDAPESVKASFHLGPPPTPETESLSLDDPERIPADLGQPTELALHVRTLAQPITQLAQLTRLKSLRIDASIDLSLVLPYLTNAPLDQMWIVGAYRDLPPSIGTLAVLDWLNIIAPLERLPDEFAGLAGLDFLALQDVVFTHLPEPVRGLPALKKLVLAAKQLVTLPELPDLTWLTLRRVGSLARLPDELAMSSRLESFGIELTTLGSIANLEIVRSLPALRSLALAKLVIDPVPLFRALAGKPLDKLEIKGSIFTAALPAELGQLQVAHLDLEGTDVVLPPELAACSQLRSISVSPQMMAAPDAPDFKALLPKGRWKKQARTNRLTYTRTD